MSTMTTRIGVIAFALACSAALLWGGIAYFDAAEPKAVASRPDAKPLMRRINEGQYRQIILDTFGPIIKVGGQFEPEVRDSQLLAIGASRVSLADSGLEEYDKMARSIAAQVVSEKNRDTLIPCKPSSQAAPDDACAAQFFKNVGELLYRRPLTQEELSRRVSLARQAAEESKDFYTGLAVSLETILETPAFLFRIEKADPAGAATLDAFSKASRLSFFIWNTAPDEQLLVAAANGKLSTKAELTRQVDRMLASPRFESGTRAFFSDMLGFDGFDTLTKDSVLYPKYNSKVSAQAQEQTLRTITYHLVNRKEDYRDLFTSGRTFLTPLLASIYGVPLPVEAEAGLVWKPYEFAQGDPRAGLLSQIAFVALHSHPGRSSPTLRGRALREVLLCQKVPDPPPNVNFTLVNDTKSAEYKTARERVTAHRTEPTCAGCHKIVDPIGLALENFETDGEYRTIENGVPIDVSGDLDGVKFSGPSGLAQAIHDSPAAPACLVNRLYAYGAGRNPTKDEAAVIAGLEKSFASRGYKFPELVRAISTSDAFYRVAPPGDLAADAQSVRSTNYVK